jgi:hypothetical protein
MVVDPSHSVMGPSVHGDHAAEVPPMIAIGFGFLALFSILSIVLSDDDSRRADPRDDVKLWMRYAIR